MSNNEVLRVGQMFRLNGHGYQFTQVKTNGGKFIELDECPKIEVGKKLIVCGIRFEVTGIQQGQVTRYRFVVNK